MSDDEFVAGYLDGRDPTSPEPSDNRSHRYRHSFWVGRSELNKTHVPYDVSMRSAEMAEQKDLLA